MKFKRTTAMILSLMALLALCACTKIEPRAAEAMHPVWQQAGTSVDFLPSIPLGDTPEAGTAIIYEIEPDFDAFKSAASTAFKCDIESMEKTQNGSTTIYKNDKCSLTYDEVTGYWSYERADCTANKSAISDELALLIAKDFVEDKNLCPGGWSEETVDAVNGDGGLLYKSVTLYPTIMGGTKVRGEYRLIIGVNADGEIIKFVNNAANLKGYSEVPLISEGKIGDAIVNESCGAGLSIEKHDPYTGREQSLARGYYADSMEHDGKCYLLPIYIITTTDSSGTRELLIDAQS